LDIIARSDGEALDDVNLVEGRGGRTEKSYVLWADDILSRRRKLHLLAGCLESLVKYQKPRVPVTKVV
jgi:hypothetical protein